MKTHKNDANLQNTFANYVGKKNLRLILFLWIKTGYSEYCRMSRLFISWHVNSI